MRLLLRCSVLVCSLSWRILFSIVILHYLYFVLVIIFLTTHIFIHILFSLTYYLIFYSSSYILHICKYIRIISCDEIQFQVSVLQLPYSL